MKITTIAISYHRKFNLGNFNSVDLSCSLWAQIDAQEDEDACVQILQSKCREHVRNEYYLAKNGSKASELFRVNVAMDEDDNQPNEDNPSLYGGLEPNEVLGTGDK